MASPWIFATRFLARRDDVYKGMVFDIEKKDNVAPRPTTRFAIADDTIRHVNNGYSPMEQAKPANVDTSSNTYHKELALMWMQYLDVEKNMPHSIFMLVLEYDGFVQSLSDVIEDLCVVPIKIQKIMGDAPLTFCESRDDTLTLIKSTPGVKKEMPLYKILAIAHIHNRSVCPWAPLHFNMSDDVFAQCIWNER